MQIGSQYRNESRGITVTIRKITDKQVVAEVQDSHRKGTRTSIYPRASFLSSVIGSGWKVISSRG